MNDAATLMTELERVGDVIDACGERACQGELVDLAGLDGLSRTSARQSWDCPRRSERR